jgi:hypothetical protein
LTNVPVPLEEPFDPTGALALTSVRDPVDPPLEDGLTT